MVVIWQVDMYKYIYVYIIAILYNYVYIYISLHMDNSLILCMLCMISIYTVYTYITHGLWVWGAATRSPVKSKRENSACPELHLLCTPKCLPLAAGTKLTKLNRNQISSPTTCFAHISREGGRVCPHLPSMHGSAADGNTITLYQQEATCGLLVAQQLGYHRNRLLLDRC